MPWPRCWLTRPRSRCPPESLNHLADLIRTHRRQRRSHSRRLDPGRQALLAATADDLGTAMTRIRLLAYAILDGTLIPIDRVSHQKPHYSGRHRRHGMNVQVIADAAGRLVWASAAVPGSTHDLTAARTHNLIDALASAKVMTFADEACQGAGGTVCTPFKRHRYRPKLSARQKAVNRAHARGERAVATLKTWKLLAKLRCSPSRTTTIVHAILVLHHVENPIYPG